MKLKFVICSLFMVWCLATGISPLFAQDNAKLVTLSKQIIEAKSNDDLYRAFEELKDSYFKENKYNEFIEFLSSLQQQKKSLEPVTNYYIALSRYYQLKHLEEIQNWDEYFAKGNDYRDDIVKEAGNAIEAAAGDNPVRIYSRLLVYQFHKDQQDTFAQGALSDLMVDTLDYVKLNKDIKPIKEIADKLLSYKELPQVKELYKLYVQGLASLDIKDEALKDIALGFYKDGNLELAENIYDFYIERISKKLPKDKLLLELKDIALAFTHKDSGFKDMPYAEKAFKRMEEIGGVEAFDEELIYSRGFNLEKTKEYRQAKDIYSLLLKKYPQNKHIDEATYKIGLIFTYILRDAKTGREYFDRLADKEAVIPHSLSSLYQMGLLKQWEGDLAAAKGYYNKLIEKSESNITDTLQMAQDRLREIEEGALLEYNLKTFMDASLKEEFTNLDMGKLDLRPDIYQPKVSQEIGISASAYLSLSGCFNVELQYLWSGDLGDGKPDAKQSEFKTSYKNQGTKMIGLVLISPSGITDYSLDFIDAR